MISRCCRAEIYSAKSEYCAQLSDDWYECSHCYRPCDTMLLISPWMEENNV